MRPRVRPVHALLALLGLAVWIGRGAQLGPVHLQPAQVAGALLAFALVVTLARTRTAPACHLSPRSAAMLVGLLVTVTAIVGAALLSASIAQDVVSVVRFAMRYALGIALLLSLASFLSERARLERLERALLVGAVASVAVAALGFVVPSVAEWAIRSGDRAQGLLNHPNQLGIMLATVTPIALASALRRPLRPLGWVVFVIVAAGVALTGSKANLLILAAMLPIAALLSAQARRSALGRIATSLALITAAALVGALALVLVRTFSPRTLATLERLLVDPGGTSTVSLRSEMWSTAIARGLEHPWVGVGADNARYYLFESHAHNVGIEFFLTLGTLGVVALAGLLGVVAAIALTSLWTAIVRRGVPAGDRLTLIGYALAALVYVAGNQTSDSFGGTTLPMLWIVIALALAQLDLVGADARAGAAERLGARA